MSAKIINRVQVRGRRYDEIECSGLERKIISGIGFRNVCAWERGRLCERRSFEDSFDGGQETIQRSYGGNGECLMRPAMRHIHSERRPNLFRYD